MMRPSCIFWIVCVGLLAERGHGQTPFPYELTVPAPGVHARSGPGTEFYETDLLAEGTKIQVYRRQGDWLGIRPPERSFSLVRSSQLRMSDAPGVAEVTEDDVACRVGSHVVELQQPVSQVRLRQHELVELADGAPPPATDGGAGWTRIRPPSGEFRWVRAEDLQAGRAERSAAANWKPRHRPPNDDLDQLELDFALQVAQPMRAWRLQPLHRRVDALAEQLSTEFQKSRARRLADRIAQFERLHDRFSQAAADWADENARKMGTGTARCGAHPSVKIQDVAEPVPIFLTPAEDPPDGSTAGETDAGETDATADTPGDASRAPEVQYDGMGWLVPVHSTKRLAPPYALLDAEGDVLQYVSPAPGLNLRRHVRQEVGIFGQRGYLPALKKPLLTAERVVDLQRHRR